MPALRTPPASGLAAEGPGGAGLGDPIVVVAENGAHHLVGVLAHRRRLGRVGQLLADEVQRREELVGADLGRRQQVEAVGELWVFEQRLWRVDRRDRRVDPSAELQPLRGRLGAEDVAQLALELTVAPSVVGVLGAGPALEEVTGVRPPRRSSSRTPAPMP